jgi:hypothetical protein
VNLIRTSVSRSLFYFNQIKDIQPMSENANKIYKDVMMLYSKLPIENIIDAFVSDSNIPMKNNEKEISDSSKTTTTTGTSDESTTAKKKKLMKKKKN